jgi:hypothetical protein
MKKMLLGFSAFTLLFAYSCKKDDDKKDDNTNTVTTVAQDKTNLAATQNAMYTCLKSLHDGKGVQTIVQFFNVANGEVLDTSWVKGMLDSLPSVVPQNGMSNGFNFDAAAGTYTYSVGSKQWTYGNTPTDKIIINFPSDKSKSANNVELIATKLIMTDIINGTDTMHLPKSGSITLNVDGGKTLELSLNNIEYANDSSHIPTAIDGSAFIDPFVFTLKETMIGSKTFKVEFDMSNNSSCVYDVNVQLDLATDDYAHINNEDIDLVTASYGFNDFKVDANVKFGVISQIDKPTVEQINSNVTATVSYNGSKIGDLKAYEVAPDSVRLYIYYKDNTSEDVLSVYGDTFKSDMEGVWSDITGSWDIKK